jgi:hypothetical protein
LFTSAAMKAMLATLSAVDLSLSETGREEEYGAGRRNFAEGLFRR